MNMANNLIELIGKQYIEKRIWGKSIETLGDISPIVIRPINIDGEGITITMEGGNGHRVNVKTEGGIITEVYGWG